MDVILPSSPQSSLLCHPERSEESFSDRKVLSSAFFEVTTSERFFVTLPLTLFYNHLLMNGLWHHAFLYS